MPIMFRPAASAARRAEENGVSANFHGQCDRLPVAVAEPFSRRERRRSARGRPQSAVREQELAYDCNVPRLPEDNVRTDFFEDDDIAEVVAKLPVR